jgi:hypothetical protein
MSNQKKLDISMEKAKYCNFRMFSIQHHEELRKIRPSGISTYLNVDLDDELYFWIRSMRGKDV